MFLLISGDYIGAPKLYTKMASAPYTKIHKGAWNVSANNSETVGTKDLRLRQIVYILVFYDISFSWHLPLDGIISNLFCCCVTVKTIYTECTSSFFRNFAASVGSKQAKRPDLPWRKQGWIPQKTIHRESSRLSTKRKLSILLNFLFPSVVFYRRIFNLEIQNFSLQNHHMMNARQSFCWWLTFTRVSNPPLPPPLM